MCLAVPGKVRELYEAKGVRMGRLDFGGILKEVCLEFVPEIREGDYAVVHAGFAISRLDEEAAAASLDAYRQMAEGLNVDQR